MSKDKSLIQQIAQELNLNIKNVESTLELLDEGGTVPFISRYRKEATGSLDEVEIANIRDRSEQLRELGKRKESILKSLKELQKLTPELEASVAEASTMAVLEDLYLPYKPKRRTKGTIAKEKCLEPLAQLIWEQSPADIKSKAEEFVDVEKQVSNSDEALAGARDIMAEWVNENSECRGLVRNLFLEKGIFKSKVMTGKEQEGQKYKDYFDWSEPVSKAPSHRVLAMRRGEKEMILMLDIFPPEEDVVTAMESIFIKNNSPSAQEVKITIKDAYKRLLKPSIETEIRMATKTKADEDAIKVFAENLRQLLLGAPLGEKNILALDPGFRTGCKVVCLDRQGKLLENTAIYPHEPQKKFAEAKAIVESLINKYSIEAVAIGNGTAGRETEQFIKSCGLSPSIQVVIVNESGASIYSASDIAREEFPDHDVTVRGSVSIGRRLMDPLAELVKIDPKSIGVGQYQHDVDQNALKQSLDDVVMSCVNKVGVEVNTASKQLLTYVSGLGPQLAQNIVEYRNTNGPFKSRSELKKVARMGDKAFEQAAGFLRIRNSENLLDASAVHPESYHIIKSMASDVGAEVADLIKKPEVRKKVDLKKYVNDKVGLPTLTDIMQELDKPGRDPREKFEAFNFTDGVNEMSDLRPGMKLPGIVTNITKFGAFVDIGVHQDGLVHISHISDRFITDPAQVLKVQQKVMATVLEVDVPRKRISLSLKSDAPKPSSPKKDKPVKEEAVGDMQSKLSQLMGKFKS